MSQFTMEKPLPPVKVTKELLRSLYAYLVAKAKTFRIDTDAEGESIESAVSITIVDALGAESLASIEEYVPSKFPDSTTRIVVELDGRWRTSLRGVSVEVKFDKDRYFSKLKVSCDRPNARELAQGIANGVHDCLTPHLKGLGWLHPTAFVQGALVSISIVGAIYIPIFFTKLSAPARIWLGSIELLWCLYTFVLPRFRPYTEFESRLTELRSKWWDWFVKGTAGFLLFGIAFALLKDYLLSVLSDS